MNFKQHYYLLVKKINKKIFIHMLTTEGVRNEPGYILIDKKTFERLRKRSLVFMFDENTPEHEMIKQLEIEEFAI